MEGHKDIRVCASLSAFLPEGALNILNEPETRKLSLRIPSHCGVMVDFSLSLSLFFQRYWDGIDIGSVSKAMFSVLNGL